jgi:hypothetical protein
LLYYDISATNERQISYADLSVQDLFHEPQWALSIMYTFLGLTTALIDLKPLAAPWNESTNLAVKVAALRLIAALEGGEWDVM